MQDPDAFDDERPPSDIPAWLVDLTIVLGVAVIVLGLWLFRETRTVSEAEEARGTSPAVGLTNLRHELPGLIEMELGALKSFLPDVYGPMHTPDSAFIDRTAGVRLTGAEQLEDALLNGDVGFSFDPVRTTDVEIAQGDVAVYGTTWGGTVGQRRFAAIVIVTFEDGRIAREVVIPMDGVRATDDLLP